jgi:hypothetical protein
MRIAKRTARKRKQAESMVATIKPVIFQACLRTPFFYFLYFNPKRLDCQEKKQKTPSSLPKSGKKGFFSVSKKRKRIHCYKKSMTAHINLSMQKDGEKREPWARRSQK